jgi:hypothetical protein
MAVYEESGLRLDLPDGAHFRFADTDSYRPLSGRFLKATSGRSPWWITIR